MPPRHVSLGMRAEVIAVVHVCNVIIDCGQLFKKDLLFLDWSQREFDPFQCAREVAEAARCKQKLSSVSQSA